MATLKRLCHECRGSGITPGGQDPAPEGSCVICNGTGYEKVGTLDTPDLADKLNDIKEKVDEIMDKLKE